MFIFIVTLAATGLVIEILDTIEDMNITIPSYLPFVASFVTTTHVLSGILLAGFTVVHMIKNHRVLRNYLKMKSSEINKEAILSLFWVVFLAISSGLIAFIWD
jgi:hypothetical protein